MQVRQAARREGAGHPIAGDAARGGPPPWLALAGLPSEHVKRARKWLLVAGGLAVLGGLVSIVVPAVASVTVAILVGWILVLVGVTLAVDAFSLRRTRERWGLRMLWAALTVVAGIYLIVAPLHGTLTLTVVLAAWFFTIGVLRLLAGLRERGTPGAGMVAVNGALSLLLGLLIAVSLPSSAAWAIGLLVGVDLIFYGVTALLLARALRPALP